MNVDDFIEFVLNEPTPGRYQANGDGSWSGGPCHTCGGHSYLLEEVPTCLLCSSRIEQVRNYVECVVASLDALADLAPKLPHFEKERVAKDIDFVALAVAKLALGVS